MINPVTKYAVAGVLAVSGACTSLHYVSRFWIALEDKAYAYVEAQEEKLTDRILARLGHSSTAPMDTQALAALVESKAKAAGLPPDLVKALVEAESGWKVDAVRFEPHLLKGSTEQARMLASSHGLLQILGSNAVNGSCPGINYWSDLYDPVKNVSCGIKILSDAKAKTGSTRKALVAYNGGLGCTTRTCPGAEAHAAKVLTSFAEMQSR